MQQNLKTAGFFLFIGILCTIPYFSPKLLKAKFLIHEESENARQLYTGKTRAVYNPLDRAYVVTEELLEMSKKEDQLNFDRYKVWPVVSIWVNPIDLHDEERGLFRNPLKKGRLWERASYITYYESGTKLFSSFAGVRIHGGENRKYPKPSLRFYFRNRYGEDTFLKDQNLGFVPGTEIKRLVLRRDTVYNFANDLSHSMINKMGGIAPKIKHVAVYLNGEFYSYMQMLEQLNRDQIKELYGHKHFLYHKLKANNRTKDRLLFENAIHRVKGESAPMSFTKMQSMLDMDNLTANMLTIMYTGNTDWAQGVWIRNQEEKNPKWSLISWDFDFAFLNRSKAQNLPAWEVNGVEIGLKQHVATLRSHLFNRLLKESPEFRNYFFQKIDRMFNEELNEIFFQEKFAEYERLANDAHENSHMKKSINAMRTFLNKRKPIFCRDLEKQLGERPSSCEMSER